MSEHQKIELGSIFTDSFVKRDAVHIAVMPMIATRVMMPGERLQNGIVDAFLTRPVQPGERYFLMLYPNTITNLRHSWEHPAFPDEKDSKKEKNRPIMESVKGVLNCLRCPECRGKRYWTDSVGAYCVFCVDPSDRPVEMAWLPNVVGAESHEEIK